MRHTVLIAAGAVIALTACSSGIKVRTSVAPDADLAGLHTFRVLSAPARRDGAPALSVNDPMLESSITNRELRQALTQAFQSRGYAPVGRDDADFLVAYYAGTKEKFDTTYWGPAWDPAWRYRYVGRPGWAWPWYAGAVPVSAQITEYTQGQVIVDVINARTRELVWRGQGVATVSDDPSKYAGELQRAVNAIVAKFPQGSAVIAADADR